MISRRTRRKLNKAFTAVLKALQSVFTKRFAAMALCLAMLVCMLPAEVFAIDWKELSSTKATGPNSEAWKAAAEAEPTHTNYSKNYYILEVSSGSRLGGGYADNVLYFAVFYTDSNDVKRTAILMPGVDAVSNGYEEAAGFSSPKARQQLVSDVFGYSTEDLLNRKALGSVTTDQILFDTVDPVKTIDKIQIFGKQSSTTSVWPCQGMRVYQVDTLYGLEMYGWFSDTGYIDFDGAVIAEAVMAPGGGNFNWNSTGGTFNITPMGDSRKDITLVRTTDKDAYESAYNTSTHIGTRVFSASRNPVVIRMDFADQSGAGFESQMVKYSEGSAPKLASAAFSEAAAMTIRYEDIFGDQRDVTLPLIVNSLGSAAEVLGKDIAISGYAQQGDSIAIPANLPNFSSVVSTTLLIGEAEATTAAGIKPSAARAANQTYKSRASLSETDDISYSCIAFYTDVNVRVGMDGSVIRYSYDAGPNNPASYSSATSLEGLSIVSKKATAISMLPYSDRVVLETRDTQTRFLVTLSTDNVANAGTTADLTIQFKYLNYKEKAVESPVYHVKDYVSAFYGNWEGNVEDFAYKYTMRDGGTTQFMVPLQDVKEFTGVIFKLEGDDEWQFSGLNIRKVNSFQDRDIDWQDLSSTEKDASGNPKYQTHIRVGRDVDAGDVLFKIGTVYYEGDNKRPAAGSDEWKPGTLIQDDDNTSEFNGKGEVVDKVDEIDWTDILHYMTYEQATQELKFTKQRCNYKVTVNVAGDKVNAEDEDCGSKNLFYFQLLFENGNSGCMLANQQIEGDAFRTGDKTEFYIPCAQDYGDLLAIRVIPDDQDGNSDIYDKLKIQSIDVEKLTDDFICPTWSATSSSGDGLGWVSIDYREPGEVGSNKGAEGRSVSEIATDYQINVSSYNAKFLVSIKTGPYGTSPQLDENGNPYYRQDPVYRGGMSMTYSYFDRDGMFQEVKTPIDIVQLMYEYSARKALHDRNTELDEENYDDMTYAISNPDYNFRAGKSDSFYITVKNISQFVNMSLQLRSDVVTHWNITDVKIYLVNGQGIRFLNGQGEYEYKYPEGKAPTLVAEWKSEEGLTADLGIYRHKQKTGVVELRNLLLECGQINLNPDAAGWTTIIAREPKSKNDTFNLFIYPQEATGDIAQPGSYVLKAAVRYTNALTLKQNQSSAGVLRTGYDSSGRLCYYALGIDGKNLDSIDGVAVETNSMKPINVPIDSGVLQVIRSGVLMENYDLGGATNADGGDYMNIRSYTIPERRFQKLLLQFSADTKAQTLEPEAKDLAVALHFYTDDPSDQELRSKYIYLTDAGYTSIKGGQLCEIDFDLGNLKSITGVNLVSLGSLDATIDGVTAYEYGQDGAVYNSFSANGPFTPTGRAGRVDSGSLMTPLTLQISTAADEGSVSSGVTGHVSMTVGYYDSYGVVRQESFEDISAFITDGGNFKAGSTATLKLLIRDMTELRWIEFEPAKDADAPASKIATWKIGTVVATAGSGGDPVTRTPDQLIVEGTPLHVSFADVIIAGKASIYATDASGAAIITEEPIAVYGVNSGGSAACLLDKGNILSIINTVYGSNEGLEGTVEGLDPATGATAKIRLGSTYSYSESYLNSTLASAQSSLASPGSEGERNAAQRVVDLITEMKASAGDFTVSGNTFTFKAPVNYTGGNLYYRITISSKELPDIKYNIDVTVYPTAEELTNAVLAWSNEQQAARSNQSGISSGSASQTNTQTPANTQTDTSSPAAVTTDSAVNNGG